MDPRAGEVWRNAPAIYEKIERIVGRPRSDVREELVAVLGISATAPDAPGVEEFEYVMHTVVMRRLESDSEAKLDEVADLLDASTAAVAELFERAAAPGTLTAETERCKQWWSMLLSVAEDIARLLPIRLLERLVGDFEHSLVRLRAAYLQLANQRLQEFDAKQEAEAKAQDEAEAAAAKDQKGKDAKASSKQDREAKRCEERKRVIAHLGISPNGQLYLTLTSLLKQLSSRLCSSLHAPLRARIVLLLEKLLAMDHKAIANNQKLRTQDYIQIEDLDTEADAASIFAAPTAPSAPVASAEPGEATVVIDGPAAAAPPADGAPAPGGQAPAPAAAAAEEAKEGRGSASVGGDPAVNYGLYKTFWGLQEALQYPERLFERKEFWVAFNKSLSGLLTLLLKYPAQDNVRQPWTQPEPAPLRHAPRARALVVQLDDPGFRQQFLTQVMIAFQALEQDGSSKRDAGGLISRQTEATRKEFQALKSLCERALKQTRETFPALLKHVLDREAHWVGWKSAGCREFERESLEMLNAKIAPADTLPDKLEPQPATKPKLQPYLNGFLKTLKDPKWRGPAPVSAAATDEEVLKGMQISAMREMCDAYLDRLIEEDRPETGIEEEYKAKKNKVFMWQCRRLFCQQYLRVYAQKDVNAKTDFMDFVRTVKGKPLAPAQQPGSTAGTEGAAEKAAGDAGEEAAGGGDEDRALEEAAAAASPQGEGEGAAAAAEEGEAPAPDGAPEADAGAPAEDGGGDVDEPPAFEVDNEEGEAGDAPVAMETVVAVEESITVVEASDSSVAAPAPPDGGGGSTEEPPAKKAKK